MDARLKAVLLSGESSSAVREEIAEEAAAAIAAERSKREESSARISANADSLGRALHDELDAATAPLCTMIEDLTHAICSH